MTQPDNIHGLAQINSPDGLLGREKTLYLSPSETAGFTSLDLTRSPRMELRTELKIGPDPARGVFSTLLDRIV
jgi:hypothetical protein